MLPVNFKTASSADLNRQTPVQAPPEALQDTRTRNDLACWRETMSDHAAASRQSGRLRKRRPSNSKLKPTQEHTTKPLHSSLRPMVKTASGGTREAKTIYTLENTPSVKDKWEKCALRAQIYVLILETGRIFEGRNLAKFRGSG